MGIIRLWFVLADVLAEPQHLNRVLYSYQVTLSVPNDSIARTLEYPGTSTKKRVKKLSRSLEEASSNRVVQVWPHSGLSTTQNQLVHTLILSRSES
jgi:hypothetical protein